MKTFAFIIEFSIMLFIAAVKNNAGQDVTTQIIDSIVD